jgi:hypothetical protein
MLQPGSVTTRRFFAEHPMVLQVGCSVFVHAGLHPRHLDIGLENINAEAQVWERHWLQRFEIAIHHSMGQCCGVVHVPSMVVVCCRGRRAT